MAQLVKNYNFGLPLNTIEELNNIERNLLTDDKYGSSLVSSCMQSRKWNNLLKQNHLASPDPDRIPEIAERIDWRQFLENVHRQLHRAMQLEWNKQQGGAEDEGLCQHNFVR